VEGPLGSWLWPARGVVKKLYRKNTGKKIQKAKGAKGMPEWTPELEPLSTAPRLRFFCGGTSLYRPGHSSFLSFRNWNQGSKKTGDFPPHLFFQRQLAFTTHNHFVFIFSKK
jgi:hypothetical protein